MAEVNPKLESLMLLARSQKGAAAAKIAIDATSTPGVYVFGELLALANIQALQNDPTHSKAYFLLQLFAYGTLATYKASPDAYPPLSPVQLCKLKHLTLVSLAMQHRSIPYDTIAAALDISSDRELENTIIDVIYAGLIGGKMFHQEKMLHVDWIAGRDVTPEELAQVGGVLDSWCNNAQNLLQALDERIHTIRAESHAYSEADTAYKALRETEYAAMIAAANDRKSTRQTRGGAAGGAGGRGGRGHGLAEDDGNFDMVDMTGAGVLGDAGWRRSGRTTGQAGSGPGAGRQGFAAGDRGQGGEDKQGLLGRLLGGDEAGKRGSKRPRD